MGYASKNPKRDGAFRRLVVQVNGPTRPHERSADITAPSPDDDLGIA